MRPFDTAVDAISQPIANAWNGITNYDDLKAENEALRDQVEHQKGDEIEAQTAITKFYELLKLNQLTSKYNYKSVIAQVVGESPSNFQNTVEITVGTRDGIAVGMPVTDGAGLDRQGHQGVPRPQCRDADHRSPVLGAGPGAQPRRRGATPPRQRLAEHPTPRPAAVRSTRPPTSSTTTTTTPESDDHHDAATNAATAGPVHDTRRARPTTTTHPRGDGASRDRRPRRPGRATSRCCSASSTTRALTNVKVGDTVETAGGTNEPRAAGHPDRQHHGGRASSWAADHRSSRWNPTPA